MPELSVLAIFIPTFFLVSITPGMCMTLAMTLGMSVGIRRTLYMMCGELLGVISVALAALAGVAALMLNYPAVFQLFKYLGGAYLVYLGVSMWRASANYQFSEPELALSKTALFTQGFVTAIANPKGWAFMIALLPPFIDNQRPLLGQAAVLLFIIMCTEFISMMAYASGGKSLKRLLSKGDNLRYLNWLAGSLLIFVGLWLALF